MKPGKRTTTAMMAAGLAGLFLVAGCSQPAEQAETGTAQTLPATRPSIETVRERVVQRYSTAGTYRWKLEVHDGIPKAGVAPAAVTVTGVRPDRLRIDEEKASVVINGQNAVLLLHEEQLAIRFDFGAPVRISDAAVLEPSIGAVMDKYLHLNLLSSPDILEGDGDPGFSPQDPNIALFHPTNDPKGDEVCAQAADGLVTWAKKFTRARPDKAWYVRTASEELNFEPDPAVFDTTVPEGYADGTDQFRGVAKGTPATELEGRAAPALSLETYQGMPMTLADERGKVVVLDFWASWCAPCIEGMPVLAELAASLDPAEAVVWGVNLDEGEEGRLLAEQAIEKTSAFYPHLKAEGSTAANDYLAGILPMLVIVDGDGVVRKVHLGDLPPVEELREMVKAAQ